MEAIDVTEAFERVSAQGNDRWLPQDSEMRVIELLVSLDDPQQSLVVHNL